MYVVLVRTTHDTVGGGTSEAMAQNLSLYVHFRGQRPYYEVMGILRVFTSTSRAQSNLP